MRRIHKIAAVALALIVTWVLGCIAVRDSEIAALQRGVYLAPVAAAAIYAAVVLCMLAWGVCTFRSVPEEAASLREEVAEARAFLRKRGVSI